MKRTKYSTDTGAACLYAGNEMTILVPNGYGDGWGFDLTVYETLEEAREWEDGAFPDTSRLSDHKEALRIQALEPRFLTSFYSFGDVSIEDIDLPKGRWALYSHDGEVIVARWE